MVLMTMTIMMMMVMTMMTMMTMMTVMMTVDWMGYTYTLIGVEEVEEGLGLHGQSKRSPGLMW